MNIKMPSLNAIIVSFILTAIFMYVYNKTTILDFLK